MPGSKADSSIALSWSNQIVCPLTIIDRLTISQYQFIVANLLISAYETHVMRCGAIRQGDGRVS